MRRILLALVALLVSSSPAWAWWEFAKWGMTRDQITAASAGKAAVRDPTEPSLYLENVEVGDLRATVQFMFNPEGGLAKTTLVFDGEFAARSLMSSLSAVYGKPVDERGSPWPMATWQNAERGTTIRLIQQSQYRVFVEYTPTAKGL